MNITGLQYIHMSPHYELYIENRRSPHEANSACKVVPVKCKKGKAVPVTGSEDPHGCEMLRLTYLL
jgi:hypothetical protein